MKHTSFEKEILRRGYEMPLYNLLIDSMGLNGHAFTLVKGSYVMEWLAWMNGNVSCLRVRHKDASWGYPFKEMKKAFDLFEKLETV